MGVTNELFQNERDETDGCRFNGIPEDHTHYDMTQPQSISAGVMQFQFFMRFLDQPTPAPACGPLPACSDSINRGQALVTSTASDGIGCALCHTPSMQTGTSSSAALSNKMANLFSDLLVHHMGSDLADNIIQGNAGPDEFRTAPLWGLGQRIFFLHDGRTSDLLDAILAHSGAGSSSFPPSEANESINRFKALSNDKKQDILNFLRSL
jgi:Di-haem oxidoreductase, putative peroxidase